MTYLFYNFVTKKNYEGCTYLHATTANLQIKTQQKKT